MRIDAFKLKVAMLRENMTIAELGAKANVAPATITAVRGGKSCTRNTALHLAAALGVSIESLLPDDVEACR